MVVACRIGVELEDVVRMSVHERCFLLRDLIWMSQQKRWIYFIVLDRELVCDQFVEVNVDFLFQEHYEVLRFHVLLYFVLCSLSQIELIWKPKCFQLLYYFQMSLLILHPFRLLCLLLERAPPRCCKFKELIESFGHLIETIYRC